MDRIIVPRSRTVTKAAFTSGQHVAGNMLLVAVNKIVASLFPVCCWIQKDTCCRDTGNLLIVAGIR